MSNNIPVVKQIAWISLIPHTLVLLLFFWLFSYLTPTGAYVYYAVVAYFLLSFGLRFFIADDQRKGMTLVKSYYFEEALLYFEKSVEFFTKNAWVDKYRYITLLASSRMTYREMGLCNMAFCYSQMGEGKKAKALYEEIQAEFPENSIAIAALNMIKAMEEDKG